MTKLKFAIIFILSVSSIIKSCSEENPLYELRGIWVSRFEYTASGKVHDPDSIKRFISSIFQNAKISNFNTIFFQVRGNADAFYKSKYEPWSELLTGKLGKEPGWDPLQYAIDETKKLGLELHAWINVFPAWRGRGKIQKTNPPHPLQKHHQWLVCDRSGKPMRKNNGYISFSPGIPYVHDHILKVIDDIITNYDVDGIHFDYIRYPDGADKTGYSHDPISVKRYQSEQNNPLGLKWDDWQREQITIFISRAYNLIKSKKPWIKVSAAVIGNYKNTNWNAYHSVYQDPARWARIGKIDFIIPMMYFNTSRFKEAIMEYKEIVPVTTPIIAGIGLYRINPIDGIKQIKIARKNRLHGISIFASSYMKGLWQIYKKNCFQYPALTPKIPNEDTFSQPPENFQIIQKGDTILFTWNHTKSYKNHMIKNYIIIYSKKKKIEKIKPELIFAIVSGKTDSFLTNYKSTYNRKFFSIATIDRFGNISQMSDPIKFKYENK